MTVALKEITAETVRRITSLAVAEGQRGFVAPNAVCLAEALFWKEAWYRAIYSDDEPVGFVMLHDGRRSEPAGDRDGPRQRWRLGQLAY